MWNIYCKYRNYWDVSRAPINLGAEGIKQGMETMQKTRGATERRSWCQVSCLVLAAVLGFHPLPGEVFNKMLIRSNFTTVLFKYFSYRFVWCDESADVNFEKSPWIGTGPPHGVLPFANLLSIPAINTFLGCPFVGSGASVVFNTPFLRYMTLWGVVAVDRKSIEKAVSRGKCVGIVPDGVAGIFKTSSHLDWTELKGFGAMFIEGNVLG